MWRLRSPDHGVARINRAAAELVVPEAAWKTCPWQPRDLLVTGLRQWLRCAGVALRDGKVVGMPSHAVDEAWHGFILCTARYAEFCDLAYGRFLHHHPEGGAPDRVAETVGSATDQLSRTVVAWSMVAEPGEACVLWDLDHHVGVDPPWGVPPEQVAAIQAKLARSSPNLRKFT